MMTDLVADMLTRIRNANMRKHDMVLVPASKMNLAVARILKEEGFIKYYKAIRPKGKPMIRIFLKYGPHQERVITQLERISKPGIRRYVAKQKVPRVLGGMGISILSTSRGVMTGRKARQTGIGGEVICNVW